ncbi:MAG: hypothetical protein AAFY26_18570 [Cyanobacteria bacterium J06638_22]
MSPIITIHASHRNVGTSFLTANLAVLLAEQGYRVGIIELDFVSELPMLFGLDPDELAHQWAELQQPGIFLPEAAWLSVGAGAIALLSGGGKEVHPVSGFRLVKQLKHEPQANRLGEDLTRLIPRLNADYILLETFPGFNEEGFLAFALSDILMLVLNLNAQDYQDTAVFIDLAQQLQVEQITLVANQVLPEIDVDQLIASLLTTYQIPVLATLTKVKPIEHAAYPHLICQTQPQHPFSQELRQMATKLLMLQ